MLERAVCETAIVWDTSMFHVVLSNRCVYVTTGWAFAGDARSTGPFSLTVADDSFAVLATLAPSPAQHN
jgi:hypothetical protein